MNVNLWKLQNKHIKQTALIIVVVLIDSQTLKIQLNSIEWNKHCKYAV